MKVIKPSFTIEQCPPYEEALRIVEKFGRKCYQSESDEGAEAFIRKRIRQKHLSILEHVSMSVSFITSRGVTHELVRARLASYSQESTRFVNLGGKQIEFIQPYWFDDINWWSKVPDHLRGIDAIDMKLEDILNYNIQPLSSWMHALVEAERYYNLLLKHGLPPQAARGVLPNDLKTDIGMSCNLRQWRDVISKRSSISATGAPHPDIRLLFDALLKEFKQRLPVFFEDMEVK